MATAVYVVPNQAAAALKPQQRLVAQLPSLQQAAYAQQQHPGYVQQQQQTAYAQQFIGGAPAQTAPNITSPAAYAQHYGHTQVQAVATQAPWQMPEFHQPSYAPPPSLTAGMPDPEAIAQQKVEHMKTLSLRETHSLQTLEDQRKQHLDSIHGQGEQQRRQALMQIEQQVKQMEMSLEYDFTEQISQTKLRYSNLRAALEQQAIQLTAEYQHKHAHDVAMKQQAQLQQEKASAEQKHMAEMQRLQQAPHISQTPAYSPAAHQVAPTGSYVPPPTPVVQVSGHVPFPGQTGSYVPPPSPYIVLPTATAGHTASYVPPPPPTETQTGSYVPPSAIMHTMATRPTVANTGSSVAPITAPLVAPVQTGSYVPPPVTNVGAPPPVMTAPLAHQPQYVKAH